MDPYGAPAGRGAMPGGWFPHITATAPQGKLFLYTRDYPGAARAILVPISSTGIPSREPRSTNVDTCARAITTLERGVRAGRCLGCLAFLLRTD